MLFAVTAVFCGIGGSFGAFGRSFRAFRRRFGTLRGRFGTLGFAAVAGVGGFGGIGALLFLAGAQVGDLLVTLVVLGVEDGLRGDEVAVQVVLYI